MGQCFVCVCSRVRSASDPSLSRIKGLVGIVLSIPLFFYPKYLPHTRHIRVQNKKDADLLSKRRRGKQALVQLALSPCGRFCYVRLFCSVHVKSLCSVYHE